MAMDRFSRKVQWDVKRSVCVASAFYLFYYGGKACLLPFISLYFRQMGLSASQTGLVFGLKSFLWFCISPIWMSIAYRVNKTKIILCYSIFIVIGSNLSLTLLPPADPRESLYVCLNETSPFSILENASIKNLTSLTEGNQTATTTTSTPSNDPTVHQTIIHDIKATSAMTQPITKPTPQVTSSPLTQINEKPQETTSQGLLTTTMIKPLVKTTEGPYQIAHEVVPKMIEENISSDEEHLIANFVQEYSKTKDWPILKQLRLIKRIRELLQQHEERVNEKSGGTNRRWAQRRTRDVGIREKRVLQDENGTSIFDSVKTLFTETKDGALKNITEKVKNFAQEIEPHLKSNTNLFLCVLIIVAAGEMLSAPVELVSDHSLYNLLDELDSLNHYGKHRVMALIGAALCGISVSIAVYFSPCVINGTINRFHIHFYLFAMLLGISFILAPFFPSYDSSSSTARSKISGNSGRSCSSCTSTLCSSCRHFLLLITIFIVGISQAPVQNFILWKIQDMDGSSELIYGSYVSVNALSAMVSSLCGRRMIKVLKPWTVAFISLFSISLQLVLYAVMPSPWLIIPLQLLNITGQSFLWTIVTHHTSTTMSSSYKESKKISNVHVFARASQQRSLHTSYVSVYQGLSFSFGSILSGFLYDYLQGDLGPILIGSAILIALWGVLFAMYQCCCLPRKLRRKYSHLISDSESDFNLTENNEFAMKHSEKNGNYISNYQNGHKSRKKGGKKSKHVIDTDSQTSEDENDWLKATMKKESRML